MDARTKRGEPVISYSQPLPPETEQVLRKAKGVNMSTVIVPLRKKRSDDFGSFRHSYTNRKVLITFRSKQIT